MNHRPENFPNVKSIIDHASRYINYRMGIYGAIIMGVIVFMINFSATELWWPSTTAALKQGAYTFFFGGVIMKFCEYLAVRIKKRLIALLAAVIIPTSIALTLTFGIHNLKGTPKPLASTIPTLMIIPATAVVGFQKRKQFTCGNNKNALP